MKVVDFAASVEPRDARIVRAALDGLPRLEGRPIRVRFFPLLSTRRRRLVSGATGGAAVHAATFLRKREIVLETELLGRPGELRRILVHEVFHFAWLRLGNAARRSYESLLEAEARRGARGELGWSAESRKLALKPRDWRERTRRWREYACESFCDTAAWLYGGNRRHSEFTLARVFRARRSRWFLAIGAPEALSL